MPERFVKSENRAKFSPKLLVALERTLGVIGEQHDKDIKTKKNEHARQIKELIKSQAEPKQSEMQCNARVAPPILRLLPECTQCYFDEKDEEGKQVVHPTIGYGNYTKTYKDRSTR